MAIRTKVFLAVSVIAIVIGFVLAGYVGPKFAAVYGTETEAHFVDISDGWFYYWVEVVGYTALFPIGLGIIIVGIALMIGGVFYIVKNMEQVSVQREHTTRTRKLVSVGLAAIVFLIILFNAGNIGEAAVRFIGGWVFILLAFLFIFPPVIVLYWGWGLIGRK
jgi:hypothetical protein